MCGIAGAVVPDGCPWSPEYLARMARSVTHRGPDDEGFFETVAGNGSCFVGLGHRRLSIIDLDTGHQPMSNEDGSIRIVFNGEIYNYPALREELVRRGHRFNTSSDTETVVHAYEEYGDRCLERFRGMFAFAVWDARRERMLLARDRFGKKPLFLYGNGGLLLFASEIKAILACPGVDRTLNEDAIREYLLYRYVPGPATLFERIRKLSPGCLAVWENGILKEERYYSPPDRFPRNASPLPPDPIGEFLQLLDESVRIRMISDVPFGAFLSGGIDSSTVVGLMARHSALPVRTFSVGFAESTYSELPHARAVAKRFSTDHHELLVSRDHVIGELPRLVGFRDAPVSEPSDIPIYLLSLEAARSVKMVLTGEGGDEILGGYPKHVYERYAGLFQRVPEWIRNAVLLPLVRALPYGFRRAKTAVATLDLREVEHRYPRWFGAISPAERDAMLRTPRPSRASPAAPPFDSPEGNTALRRILYFDQTSWLPDNLLERGDRMTMAASIEARMPFMDQDLARFVSGLPDPFRVRGIRTKWILREAVKGFLPEEILRRAKVGFRVPVNEWFRGTMREYLRDHLTGSASRIRGYVRQDAIERILREHQEGRQNHEKLLWALLNLEIWHRLYITA